MERVAKFEKVSYARFKEDYCKVFCAPGEEEIRKIYEDIKLPTRATKGSAGYDLKSPFDFTLKKDETITIPTGIRVRMKEGVVLLLFPRSGLGYKYRLGLDNTVGVIDSDYYDSDNEGHIFCRITSDAKQEKTLSVKKGDGFMQGVFVSFGITEDDEACALRNGGFGSTTA